MTIKPSIGIAAMCLTLGACNNAPEEKPEDITTAIPVDGDEAENADTTSEANAKKMPPEPQSASTRGQEDTLIRGGSDTAGQIPPAGSKLQRADPKP